MRLKVMSRKVSRKYVISAIFLCVLCFIVHFLLGYNEPSNLIKLKIINDLIYSDDNQVECQMPNLPIISPEMMKFIRPPPLLECETDAEEWVECKGSTCLVNQNISGEIICSFSDLLRNNDFQFSYGKEYITNVKYELKDSDFVKVRCWTKHSERTWSSILFGIREHIHLESKSNPITPQLNILMFGFDSLSRNSFQRSLPQTYDYLTRHLNGDILEGYNIVGDGTPQALIPILTGFTELELPDTRRRVSKSYSVDVYPMIWKNYENAGYLTAFNEDIPIVGTFSFRLNGFEQQPTHHYMRTFYQAIDQELYKYKRLCYNRSPRHTIMLNYTEQFMLNNRNYSKFIFSFHGELSHDSINLISLADNDVRNWLNRLKDNQILNNTVLILMSDHGNRFAKVRDTFQGKLEERLPFFSFVFPKWFKTEHKIAYKNFKKNLPKLTTPFDIHATLMDLLYYNTPKHFKTDNSKSAENLSTRRAISLFDKIPKNRTCADAYIEPHWCACLNWREINMTADVDQIVKRATNAVIAEINKFITLNLCEQLQLDRITWAGKLSANNNLLKFKQNKDADGYLADLSSHTKILSQLYQIKFIVNPGQSIFEASVSHHLITDTFTVKLSDISRINKYGDQAKCILDLNPELRKFCFCKN